MNSSFQPESFARGKHAYVIDDDASVRRTLGRALSIHGCDAHEFSSAEDFLKKAAIFRPAVLLIDIQMPQINGVELQDELQVRGLKLPVIFISGESTLQQTIAAMKHGPLDFLLKPFDLNVLTELVDKAIEQDLKQLQLLSRQKDCQKRLELLKPREKEAFYCLAKGHSYGEMMQALGISLPTAKQYRAAVMRKLEFASLAELIQFHQDLHASES